MDFKKYIVDNNDLVSAIDRIDEGSRIEGCFRTSKVAHSEGKMDIEKTVRDYFCKHIELSRRGEFVPSKRVSFNEAVRDFDRYFVMRLRTVINRMKCESICLSLMPWIYDCPKPMKSEMSDWIRSWDDDGKRHTWFEMVVRNEYPTYHIAYSPYWLNGDGMNMLAIAVIGFKKK